MGSRLYNVNTGRFLQIDPEYGGNANAYIYPDDPINSFDPTGNESWGRVHFWAMGYDYYVSRARTKSVWDWLDSGKGGGGLGQNVTIVAAVTFCGKFIGTDTWWQAALDGACGLFVYAAWNAVAERFRIQAGKDHCVEIRMKYALMATPSEGFQEIEGNNGEYCED
jgi:hypothetical protein